MTTYRVLFKRFSQDIEILWEVKPYLLLRTIRLSDTARVDLFRLAKSAYIPINMTDSSGWNIKILYVRVSEHALSVPNDSN